LSERQIPGLVSHALLVRSRANGDRRHHGGELEPARDVCAAFGLRSQNNFPIDLQACSITGANN
jgi:hypothetical protein